MKAKFNTGILTVEVEGEVEEIAQLISRQAPIATRRTVDLNPERKPKAKYKGSKKKGKAAKIATRKKRVPRQRKNWTPEEDAKFKELYNKKKSIKEMCDVLKRSERSVYQHMIVLRNKGEIDAL